jgi:peptidoglycan/LPS O-acetylase OafA/YrhL
VTRGVKPVRSRPAKPAAAHAERVFGLDLVRFVAVSLVLAAHAGDVFYPVWQAPRLLETFGVCGVELFFVLSGFLIGGIIIDTLERDPRWLANFWLRRWMRTLPSYLLFLLLNVLLVQLMYHRWLWWGSYATFTQALYWPHPQFFNEAWSLAVEEVFYLLAPLLALAAWPLVRTGWHAIALLVLAVVAVAALRHGYVQAYNPPFDAGVRKVTLIRLDAILYGVIATYACRRWTVGIGMRRALAGGGLAIAGVAIWMLASGRVNTDPWTRAVFFSVMPLGLAATLPLPAVATGRRVPAVIERVVRYGALWSYSLYLCILPVQRIMIWRNIGGTTWLGCAAASAGFLVVAVAWAAANYAVVERPIMRARGRVADRLGLLPAAALPDDVAAAS